MWKHEATRRNVEQLRRDGIRILQPDEGEMACGEYGPGRLPEPDAVYAAIAEMLGSKARLAGKRIIVTAGPTHEPIDPVRMIANRSSGKQGFAIAEALAKLGAEVSLIAGAVSLATPPGVQRINVVTAEEMGQAVEQSLPADAAIMVAAVADWRVDPAANKIKKGAGPATLSLIENPDLLAGLASSPQRPSLLIGFAAETEEVIANARAKLERKGCDWIVANDVSGDVMGGDTNTIHLVTADGVESWEQASKRHVADRLAERIADAFD